MRLQLTALMLALVTAVAVVAAGQAGSAQVALEAARKIEVVDGNLNAAITQYQAIVDKYAKTNRAVAATALMHIADCHQKLGDAQARGAYDRILRDFGDVSDVAAAARLRLADLNAGAHSAAGSALALRKVYSGRGLDWCNGLSSDVRYLSYLDWNTGNVAVEDLSTGHTRAVTTNGSISQLHGEFGECTVFSPDDKQIAFFWSAKDGASEIRTIGVDGSRVRVLYRDAENYLQPVDWSSDGQKILTVVHRKSGSRQIVTIAASDGAMHVVKNVEGTAANARFSPDGRYVAYSAPASAESTKSDISIVASDGTRDTAVVRHPAGDSLLGWAPDGRKLFFASDRTGANGVWSLEIEAGQPRGAPALVKANIGAIWPIRFIQGTLYYGTRSSLSDVYIASIDPGTGARTSEPQLAKAALSGGDYMPDWSPDGKSLAYRSFQGGSDPWSATRAVVSILNLQTGDERQLRPALDALDANDGPRWSPDGRSVLVIAQSMTPQHGVYRIDVQTSATTLLVKAPAGQYLMHARWSPDGRSVFYTMGNPTRIVRHDLGTGADVDLVSLTGPVGLTNIAVSPDGQSIAFTSRAAAVTPISSVNIMPAAGGAAREIYRASANEMLSLGTWMADGRYIFFSKSMSVYAEPAGSPKVEIWRVTPDGRAAEKSALDTPGRFSPDGRQVAFSKGQTIGEMWALENLAPAKKGGSH